MKQAFVDFMQNWYYAQPTRSRDRCSLLHELHCVSKSI